MTDDRARVCAYAAERIGFDYDLKNIIDLMRYLFPLPVPQRWRRRMMALGSGHPTRIICSALIAQAFETVRYPILPKVTRLDSEAARQEILEIRHSSLYAPRDFDISPYFEVVKPTIVRGFDYKTIGLGRFAGCPIPTRLIPLVPARRRYALAGGVDRRPCSPRGRHYLSAGMIDAAIKALSQMFAPSLAPRAAQGRRTCADSDRVTIGICMQRCPGRAGRKPAPIWAEQTAGVAPHAVWSCARLGAVDPRRPGHHYRRAVSDAGGHRICRQLSLSTKSPKLSSGNIIRPNQPAAPCRSFAP